MERVRFITFGSNAAFGAFQPGDIMRVSPELAKHLVDDLGCAERVDAADKVQLREDGPTIAEFLAAGYQASNYPPKGYASRSTAEEIAAAVAAQPKAKPSDGLKVDELKAALAAKNIEIPEGVRLKEDLAALLDGAEPA